MLYPLGKINVWLNPGQIRRLLSGTLFKKIIIEALGDVKGVKAGGANRAIRALIKESY